MREGAEKWEYVWLSGHMSSGTVFHPLLLTVFHCVSLRSSERAESLFWHKLVLAWEGCPQASASQQLPKQGVPEHTVLWSLFPSTSLCLGPEAEQLAC